MATKRRILRAIALFLLVISIVLGACGCDRFNKKSHKNHDGEDDDGGEKIVSGELAINFIELGNKYTGDCTYIKAGENDILIDAGSRTSSIATIDEYLKKYVTDGTLEYVIVTHAHQDHFAGFATNEKTSSIFDLYECEIIIDFSQITEGREEKTMYKNYVRERDDEIKKGAVHYPADKCIKEKKNKFDLGFGIELEILDSYFYYNVSGEENNHSVCAMINQGDRHFLFTGDLEAEGEEKLVEMNDLPKVTVYKAGHHGSKTSSSEALLEVIRPEIVCVCCCCGSPEYSKNNPATRFPTQVFIDRIAPYTDRVYVTTISLPEDYEKDKFHSMNGDIRVISGVGEVRVECSNNNTLFKDTEYFKEWRICPKAWREAG